MVTPGTKYVVKISIPIPNYLGNGIHLQELFFDKSPTKEIVINLLEELHKQACKYDLYFSCWQDCIKAVDLVKDWRFLNIPPSEGRLVATNTFVYLEKFGKQPFSWEVVSVHVTEL